jgi:hypothetical protein
MAMTSLCRFAFPLTTDLNPQEEFSLLDGTCKQRLPTPLFSPAHVIPIPYFIFNGSLVDPRLRASNEHIPIVRVARAQETNRLPSSPLPGSFLLCQVLKHIFNTSTAPLYK